MKQGFHVTPKIHVTSAVKNYIFFQLTLANTHSGCLHHVKSGDTNRKTTEKLLSIFRIKLKMTHKGSADVTLTPHAVSMLHLHAQNLF